VWFIYSNSYYLFFSSSFSIISLWFESFNYWYSTFDLYTLFFRSYSRLSLLILKSLSSRSMSMSYLLNCSFSLSTTRLLLISAFSATYKDSFSLRSEFTTYSCKRVGGLYSIVAILISEVWGKRGRVLDLELCLRGAQPLFLEWLWFTLWVGDIDLLCF